MKLNGSLVVPLYRQVMDDLRGQVDRGRYAPGDKIPSESELSEQYAVSRITIRRAIEELVSAGLLTKRQGKGTYVNPPKLAHKIIQRHDVRTFVETCGDAGRSATMRVLCCERVAADAACCAYLGLAEGSDLLRIQSMGLADGVPVMLENDLLPYDEFSFLQEMDLDDTSVFRSISARVSRHPAGIDRCRVEIVRAAADAAELLEVPISEPLFSIDSHLHDETGAPLVVSRALTVGSRFAFDLA